ncbi:MAG TPA: carbamoyl phosphate synthase small subunit, partial [Polyangia bacterium]
MADSARLVLEDGTVVRGRAFGARPKMEEAGAGEVVFNTALTGYEEVVTDPSYRGQIVVMTAPEIGNTGWNQEDLESTRPWLSGFVVRELSPVVSNWRSQSSLDEVLAKAGVPGIEGVDTRMLTQKLRDQGAMRGLITADAKLSDAALVDYVKKTPGLEGRDLVREVTSPSPFGWDEGSWHHAQDVAPRRPRDKHVVAYDFGMKRNILRMLVDAGCRVTVVPATTPAAEVLALRPDGVFLSNGPGDPAAVTYAAEACRAIVAKKVPLFGICLGH